MRPTFPRRAPAAFALVALISGSIPAAPVLAFEPAPAGSGTGCDMEGNYAAMVLAGEGGSAGQFATNPSSTATGSYQFLYGTLADLGYIDTARSRRPAPGAGSWEGVVWNGKDGIYSRDAFMASPAAQDNALREFTQGNLDLISGTYSEGEIVNGVPMSSGGAAYATHMLGAGAFRTWAASGFSPSGLDAGIAADHGWSRDQYNDHLMRRVAEGGCHDPGTIEGFGSSGTTTIDPLPEIFLMPWSPHSRAPVVLPGQLRVIGPI